MACYDCGLEYGGVGWIEAIIPDKVWNDISPTGDQGGILCILCISRRLERKGYKNIPVWLAGTEPLEAFFGDPGEGANYCILRNWGPKEEE